MTTTVLNPVNPVNSTVTAFSQKGIYDLYGNRLSVHQAQDLFNRNEKIVVSEIGEKLFKLMYGIIQCETHNLEAFHNTPFGERVEWHSVKHLSADGTGPARWKTQNESGYWSIVRVHFCLNGEMIVSQFPGKFKNES